jgi:hypothetical protein
MVMFFSHHFAEFNSKGAVTFSPCNVTSWGGDLLLLDIDAAGEVLIFPSSFFNY